MIQEMHYIEVKYYRIIEYFVEKSLENHGILYNAGKSFDDAQNFPPFKQKQI
jgi:hypothetical protein